MNTRSPYGPMVQQQRTSTARPPMANAQVQNRPMQYQRQPPPPAQQPKANALGGMLGKSGGGAMGMMGSAMSDERSKREIEQLESANEALTKALSSKAEYPDTTARSSGMQALGQQAVPPSSASFPDAPADVVAERVAAQNVAMGGQSYNERLAPNSGKKFDQRYGDGGGARVMGSASGVEYPYTWDAQEAGATATPDTHAAARPGFPKPGMPNMADLDEAYARMGQGG